MVKPEQSAALCSGQEIAGEATSVLHNDWLRTVDMRLLITGFLVLPVQPKSEAFDSGMHMIIDGAD